MIPLRRVLLFTFLFPSDSRRSTLIGNSEYDAHQQSDTGETFVPRGRGTVLSRRSDRQQLRAPGSPEMLPRVDTWFDNAGQIVVPSGDDGLKEEAAELPANEQRHPIGAAWDTRPGWITPRPQAVDGRTDSIKEDPSRERLSPSRRAFLLAAAATSVQQPAMAGNIDDAAQIEGILDRAKRGALTTDNVIYRAMTDQLVDPSQIDSCEVLERIYKVDLRAAEELRKTNDEILKLAAAAGDSDRSSLDGKSPQSLRESYTIGRLLEARIRERASLINLKYARQCNADNDFEERYSRDDDSRSRFGGISGY